MGALTKSDERWFEAARRMALESTYDGTKVGCVLVYRHRIIGSGSNMNRTDTLQAYANRFRKMNDAGGTYIQHKAHAEITALKSVPHTVSTQVDWCRVKCYTYRICPGKAGGKGLSAPCPGCLRTLRERGVREFCYTLDEGFGYARYDKADGG
jgi:hypothetical protein